MSFFLCRTNYALIQILILLTFMQRHHFFKIKTVNLDSDIFIQEDQMSNKLTVPLIRNLTQRKSRSGKKKRIESQEHNIKIQEKQYKNNPSIQKGITNNIQPCYVNFENNFLKRHSKTNSSHQNNENSKDFYFKRYNHLYSRAIEGKDEDPQVGFEMHIPKKLGYSKDRMICQLNNVRAKDVRSVESRTGGQKEGGRNEEVIQVDPYTKTQYIYMRNRHKDEIAQMKKSQRFIQMSSITKSYKVASMSLTPQTCRRSNSIKLPIPNISHKIRQHHQHNLSLIPPIKKQSQIKPWQWNGVEDSREYLI